MVRLQIDIKKWQVFAVILISLVTITIAYGTTTPTEMGHSGGEIHVNIGAGQQPIEPILQNYLARITALETAAAPLTFIGSGTKNNFDIGTGNYHAFLTYAELGGRPGSTAETFIIQIGPFDEGGASGFFQLSGVGTFTLPETTNANPVNYFDIPVTTSAHAFVQGRDDISMRFVPRTGHQAGEVHVKIDSVVAKKTGVPYKVWRLNG